MCGRFVLTHPSDALARLFDAVPDNDLPDVPNHNICPTVMIHAVTRPAQEANPDAAEQAGTARDGTGRRLRALRWGFVPHWATAMNDGPLLINARAETIAAKPAFRAAVRSRRCIVPASGFYEWVKDAEQGRLPFYIHSARAEPLALAAIWQSWGQGEARCDTCAIVTTAASDRMGRIHHRMPVILATGDWPTWLGETGRKAAPLMRPAPEDALVMYRVGREVNSNRATGPRLVSPLS
ncbi:SOS response-associated peptidase [Profundibacterium mesophilum]|uniref:Abasic site processing protein n=1 Tax=Profundibacterium mesophilum KAUST100406-0324 TaxID=1037889 RepID=A0A921NSG1_9RHOB|nr:SOS response-associated peptidase [Profundibacterium mesophilum]KAF0674538.1 protein tyrosine phosphatase non-receptor type 1 [Profundibacterium mesophilum KAUST100406-0324]